MTLIPFSPFNFDLSAKIFAKGDRQIRIYENGKFRQVIRINDKLVLLTLESKGTIENPRINAGLKSIDQIDSTDKEETKKIVCRLFNLDLNLADFYAVAKKDEALKQIIKMLYGLRSPTTQTVYEALVDSIIEQQISLMVATSLERTMIKKFGEQLVVDGETFYAYPTPKSLSEGSIEEFRECGLSIRKAEYIKEISALVAERRLDLEKYRTYKKAKEIVRELDNLRGVGVWTAELTTIRSLQKWDFMPADDVGLRRIIAHYYCEGKKITSDQARNIAEPWGKWRGLAAFYFIIADLLKIDA